LTTSRGAPRHRRAARVPRCGQRGQPRRALRRLPVSARRRNRVTNPASRRTHRLAVHGLDSYGATRLGVKVV
jgi:hypothetical protein